MLTLYRTTLAMFCLASILPLGAQAEDAEKAAPAAEAAAPSPRAALLERSQEDAQALERRVAKAEQQTLQAGNESFLALWKPANDSDPKGALIIVPGAGENADWPTTVGPLRSKFPDAGWHTLSVSLPDLLADSPRRASRARLRRSLRKALAKALQPRTPLQMPMPMSPRPPRPRPIPRRAPMPSRPANTTIRPTPSGSLPGWTRPWPMPRSRKPAASCC